MDILALTIQSEMMTPVFGSLLMMAHLRWLVQARKDGSLEDVSEAVARIKKHEFFAAIDWDLLFHCKRPAELN